MSNFEFNWQVAAVTGLVGAAVLYYLFGSSSSSSKKSSGLNPKEYRKFKLISKKDVSHNTRRFRYALQSADTVLGLPVGQHMMVRVPGFMDPDDAEEHVEKPYTPVSSDDQVGYFELVIKIYPDGRLTPRLDAMAIGEEIEVMGPRGRITYVAPGTFNIHKPMRAEKRRLRLLEDDTTTATATDTVGVLAGIKHVAMIAGGTGITPMLQVMMQVCKHADDDTRLYLIFGNQSIDDILCREELEALAAEHDNVTVVFTLDQVWSLLRD